MEKDIFYSQCWEDPVILFKALKPSKKDVIVSISSAGDNSLALLQLPIKKLYSIDNNPYQNFVLRLKVASVKNLEKRDSLKLLGFTYSSNRFFVFNSIAHDLSADAVNYFMKRRVIIERGIINAGKFENYFRYFRKLILPFLLSKKKILKFLSFKNIEEQNEFYKNHWNSYLWRKLFLVFYGKKIMNKIGRHPLFFKYTGISDIGKNYLKRAEFGITKIPIRNNYMLEYIMTGKISGRNGYPEYMQKEKYNLIKANIDKIDIQTIDLFSFLKKLPDNSIDAFNLSDVFELFSDSDFKNCFEEIYRVSKNGARICYWQNLVLRELPASLKDKFLNHKSLADNLHSIDRGFFYNKLKVLEVVK